MNIYEFAQLINTTLEISYIPKFASTRSPMFTVHFYGCEEKDGICLRSIFGRGESISEALKDYTQQLSGKDIVLNSMNDTYRREYTVPELTTL